MSMQIDRTDDRDSPAEYVAVIPQSGRNIKLATEFTIVLSCGPAEDWAAYFGPPTWTVQRIAEYGEKLPRDAALVMFPNVKGRYRE